MAKEKEEKILDDIEKRAGELQGRLNFLEKPLELLTAWMNRNKAKIDELFAIAEQIKSWYEKGYFDEMNYSIAANTIFVLLQELEKKVKFISGLFKLELRAAKRAEAKLLKIEREEIAITEMEKGKMREDVLGELSRVKEAENKFNQIIGSIRLFWKKLIDLDTDLKAERELYGRYIKTSRINELMKGTRMGKIEAEIDHIRNVILPSEGAVQKNLTFISNTILTLRSHVAALKKGAKYVTIKAA